MVIWTIRARRKLSEALAARTVIDYSATEKAREHLSGILQKTFHGEQVRLVVQDLFSGYRPDAENFILLVEVVSDEYLGAYVVKHGPEPDMEKELQAWNSCKPEGLRNDMGLMTLDAKRDNQTKLISILYGDAQQFIGVEQTVPLEQAMLDTVLYGNPSLTSIHQVIFALYERLGRLLYGTSYDELGYKSRNNAGERERILVMERLWESLQRWGMVVLPLNRHLADVAYQKFAYAPDEHAKSIRNAIRPGTPPKPLYIDPVDYLAYLKAYTTWAVPMREVTGDRNDTTWRLLPPSCSPRPADAPPVEELLPIFRRARAHGDLHGRNILVGIVEDEAIWPAVYDFEHMRPDNFLAWDFVKLEMELKIRAFERIHPQTPMHSFFPLVMQFEDGLNRWTKWCDDGQRWPKDGELPAGVRLPM